MVYPVTVRSKDGTTLEIKAEAVLIALGREPNLKGLELENAGVDLTSLPV